MRYQHMLLTKLAALNYEQRPNERDLREASAITGVSAEKICRVARYNHVDNICDVYFREPLKRYIDDNPLFVVSMAVAKSGRVTMLKDTDGHYHSIW